MIFWKSCDKVRKYHSFKSYDEYTYITERNFKYSGVDQELSQYLRPWQPESSVLHLVQSNIMTVTAFLCLSLVLADRVK